MRVSVMGRGYERKVREALAGTPTQDPRRELFGLGKEDRWFHLLIAYVGHARPERRPLAREVLRMRTPQFDMAGRLRRELCLHLSRGERQAAYQAFLAGDSAAARGACDRAISAAKEMLKPIKYWKKRKSDSLMKRDREEAGLTYLVAQDFKRAKFNLRRCQDERRKLMYRAEVLMAEGKPQEAAKILLAMTKDGKERPPELEFQLAHLTLLLGRPEQARRFLDRMTPGVVSESLPWRGSETTRALVEGRGWWPGQKGQ